METTPFASTFSGSVLALGLIKYCQIGAFAFGFVTKCYAVALSVNSPYPRLLLSEMTPATLC